MHNDRMTAIDQTRNGARDASINPGVPIRPPPPEPPLDSSEFSLTLSTEFPEKGGRAARRSTEQTPEGRPSTALPAPLCIVHPSPVDSASRGPGRMAPPKGGSKRLFGEAGVSCGRRHVGSAAEPFRGGRWEPITDIARALASATAAERGAASIHLGLRNPENLDWGTVVAIVSEDPEESGMAQVEILADGCLLVRWRWIDQDGRRHDEAIKVG